MAAPLSLFVQKNIRDHYDRRVPQIMQELNNLLKAQYEIKVNFQELSAGITGEKDQKRFLGSVASASLDNLVERLKNLRDGVRNRISPFCSAKS